MAQAFIQEVILPLQKLARGMYLLAWGRYCALKVLNSAVLRLLEIRDGLSATPTADACGCTSVFLFDSQAGTGPGLKG